jgi:vesicle coat complex subunit
LLIFSGAIASVGLEIGLLSVIWLIDVGRFIVRLLHKFSSAFLFIMILLAGLIVMRRSQVGANSQLPAVLTQDFRSKGVNQLFQDLKASDPNVRWKAADALGFRTELAEVVVPELIRTLQDPDIDVRARAAVSLGTMGAASEKAVPALVTTLKDPEKKVRREAAWALSAVGKSVDSAVPALIAMLEDSDYEVRYYAAMALGKMKASAKVAVPKLFTLVQDPHKGVRFGAASSLCIIEEYSDLCKEALCKVSDDPINCNVR